jgi:hypothetical protein
VTYLEQAKLARDTTKNAWLHRALCKLVELAEGYRIVKDDDRCECDEEGEGPCVWCQMKEAVEELDKEVKHEVQQGKPAEVPVQHGPVAEAVLAEKDVQAQQPVYLHPSYWCCRADYPNHEPGCKNAVKGP